VDLCEGEVPDSPWLRQVITRRTQRRYTDQPVPDALVRLLLAAAFSASAKSDFQQASALWLKDRVARDKIAAFYPDMPWIGTSPVFLVFLGDARRLGRISDLRGHKQDNGSMEGSSTPRSTPRWRCRPASSPPRQSGSAPVRSACCATGSRKSARS